MLKKCYICRIKLIDMSTTIIRNATLVNQGKSTLSTLVIQDETITAVVDGDVNPDISADVDIDATGLYLIPGVIDDHVHFREPGLTHKADMDTESQAAAAGGVTSVFDMPNVSPLTVSFDTWQQRMDIAKGKMHVNYAFFIGATNDNIEEILRIPADKYPGVKLFMGSSTGNMLVDREEALRQIFARSPKIIMAHCEDTQTISRNMAKAKQIYGEDPSVIHHPEIRSREACYDSTSLAVRMAKESGARLHIAHITTKEELDMLGGDITGEACVAHLLYCDADYERLGSLIKCNPAIKTADDRAALRQALSDGRIKVVATDHAPHLLSEKQGGAAKAASGMPMVQFSLVSMLEMVSLGVLSIERMVELMSHNPARLFGIKDRGFLLPGMKADVVLVGRDERPYTIRESDILSRPHWSPRIGDTLHWRVHKTWVNGQLVWNGDTVDVSVHGQALEFES